ncbi:hypothetical protein DFH29DRAFT_536537 [Suillus ampliporus]|nr:hypothetical protein DFH29DRAFT_536537 [Suillus ampliporus]
MYLMLSHVCINRLANCTTAFACLLGIWHVLVGPQKVWAGVESRSTQALLLFSGGIKLFAPGHDVHAQDSETSSSDMLGPASGSGSQALVSQAHGTCVVRSRVHVPHLAP